MSLDLDQMLEGIWRPLGFDDDNPEECPRTLMILNLNKSFWEIMDKFHFREKEKTGTFATVAGLDRYDMPEPFEALQQLAILDSEDSGRKIPLIRMSADTYESVHSTLEENWGIPTHYVREGCSVRLEPIPNDVFTMTIRRLITLTDISTSNTTPDIPQAWHELIEQGGLWRCAKDIGDFNKMNYIRQLQVSAMNSMIPTEMKEKLANTRLAGLNVVGHDYNQSYDYNYDR